MNLEKMIRVNAARKAIDSCARLTLKLVRGELSPQGVVVTKTPHGEYLVRYRGAPAGEGYFANDLQDALETGRFMLTRREDVIRLADQAVDELTETVFTRMQQLATDIQKLEYQI